MNYFDSAYILIFFCPDGQAGIERLIPMLGQFQNGFYAVKNSDFLSVCGGHGEGFTACGKGRTGDGKLAAGCPDRHLRGVFVLVLRQSADAPYIVLVQFLKLRQGTVGVAACEYTHGLRVAVVGLNGESFVGRYPFQPVVDTVGGAGQPVVAGVLPVAAANGAACGLGQILPVPGLLDGDSAAAPQRGGACRECEQAKQG